MIMFFGVVFLIVSAVLLTISILYDYEILLFFIILFAVCGFGMTHTAYNDKYKEGYNQGATDYALGKCKVDTIEVKYNVTKQDGKK